MPDEHRQPLRPVQLATGSTAASDQADRQQQVGGLVARVNDTLSRIYGQNIEITAAPDGIPDASISMDDLYDPVSNTEVGIGSQARLQALSEAMAQAFDANDGELLRHLELMNQWEHIIGSEVRGNIARQDAVRAAAINEELDRGQLEDERSANSELTHGLFDSDSDVDEPRLNQERESELDTEAAAAGRTRAREEAGPPDGEPPAQRMRVESRGLDPQIEAALDAALRRLEPGLENRDRDPSQRGR